MWNLLEKIEGRARNRLPWPRSAFEGENKCAAAVRKVKNSKGKMQKSNMGPLLNLIKRRSQREGGCV